MAILGSSCSNIVSRKLEYAPYREKLKREQQIEAHRQSNFWLSIFSCIYVLEEYNRKILEEKFRSGDSAHAFVQMFAKFFHFERERLRAEYGITLEELKAMLGSVNESPEKKPIAEQFLQDLYQELSCR